MISKIWVAFFVLAFVGGAATGRMEAVSQAAVQGAAQAVELIIQMVGLMMLWSGVMEVLASSGLGKALAQIMRPLLKKGFRKCDTQGIQLISANITANLFGLSNAATPIGLRAADRLYTLEGRKGVPDTVLTLIILNTTSIQLVPATVAALRAGMGTNNPFDILPAVWGASICSVAAALFSAHCFRVRASNSKTGRKPSGDIMPDSVE